LLATGPIAGSAYFDRSFSQACLEQVRKIQQLCQDYALPMVAVALQWCSRHPQIATTIPGAQNPAEATENAKAASVNIPERFWHDLEPLVRHWEQGVHR
jgi:D-threo-aldose 1-dehydrogenase